MPTTSPEYSTLGAPSPMPFADSRAPLLIHNHRRLAVSLPCPRPRNSSSTTPSLNPSRRRRATAGAPAGPSCSPFSLCLLPLPRSQLSFSLSCFGQGTAGGRHGFGVSPPPHRLDPLLRARPRPSSPGSARLWPPSPLPHHRSPGDPSWTCCCRQVPPAGVPAPAPRPSEPLLAAPTPCPSFVFHHGRGGAAEPRHGSVLGFVKTAKTHTWIVKFDYTKPPSTTTIADAKTGPTSTPMTVETAKFHYRRHVRLHHGHT